ncbi:predicted protein [Lichtheimia corymbifera JMRC:FSU:9682]|uniref:MULE transposase domain-containing protein n=1 Tax=Lichtheimia corymbifera JMRC:FSU:9682 TaxID=1263082 RepID=A0A068RRE6_9FUNG|nr:predicted protein [Lichtheimia corymbifera JMRC:FSU:9682]
MDSYMWVAEELYNIVWKPIGIVPGVMITDYDPSLLGAIKNTYNGTTFMLCTVHVKNNFKKNCFKGFGGSVDKHNSLLQAAGHLIYSEDDESYNKAKNVFLSIAKTSTKAIDIANYLNRYVSNFCGSHQMMMQVDNERYYSHRSFL